MTTHSIARLIGVASVSATSVWITETGGVPWKSWRFSRTVRTVARRDVEADRMFRYASTPWGDWELSTWEP